MSYILCNLVLDGRLEEFQKLRAQDLILRVGEVDRAGSVKGIERRSARRIGRECIES